MNATPGILLAVALSLLAAGCIGIDDEPQPEPLSQQAAEPNGIETTQPALGLEGTGCTQGGGHSVHPREVAGAWNLSAQVPDPWRVADVIEDTGDQVLYSEVPDPTTPTPQEGNTWGHYHAALTCDAWTLDGDPLEDAILGFVGPKVQTPTFAPSPAGDAYLATVIATNHDDVYERLQQGGIDAMHAQASLETQEDTVRVQMVTDHNGEYLSVYQLDQIGPYTEDRIRLWFQQENTNGTYTPVALDMHVDGGTHYGSLEQGYFHHSGTAHHWPLPGAYGHTPAVHYDGFDVTLTWGPAPEVAHEDRYDH